MHAIQVTLLAAVLFLELVHRVLLFSMFIYFH